MADFVVHELVEDALRELADEAAQRDLWLSVGESDVSSFGECIDRLWNDSCLVLALEGDGVVYAPHIDDRFRALDQLLRRLDARRAPDEILEDPLLRDVRALAQDLLSTLREYGSDRR